MKKDDNHDYSKRTGTGTETGNRARQSLDSIRSNDGNKPSDTSEDRRNLVETGKTIERSSNNSKRFDGTEKQDGSVDNRRIRRRIRLGNKRNGNNSDAARTGTGTGKRTGTGTGTEKATDETGEIPFFVNRKARTTKAAKKANEKMIAVSMLSIGCSALYGTVAQFSGEHWKLEANESIELASALNDALSTLPDTTYEKLFSIIEQYIPWIALAITAGTITIPRIQYTQRLKAERRNPNYANSARGDNRQGNVESNNVAGNSDDTANDRSGIIAFDWKYK